MSADAEPFSPQAFDEAFFTAPASVWREGLLQRRYSAPELLEAVWERILRRNPTLNALAAYDHEVGLGATPRSPSAEFRAASRGRWRDCRSPSRTVLKPPG